MLEPEELKDSKPDLLFILIMGLLSMLTPLAIDMYLPAFVKIANDLNVSEEMISQTLALFTLGFAFGQLFWGPLSDSYGRKPIILIGIITSALVSLAITQIHHIHHFYILRFVQGFFGASPAVVTGALLRDLFAKNEFARQMSMIMIVTMIAPLIAPVLGGHLTDWFHWHIIFYVLMILGLLAALLVSYKIPETLPKFKRVPLKIGNTLRIYGKLLSNKKVLGYIFCNSLSYSGMFCFITTGSIVYTKLFGVAPQHFGYFFLLNVIVMMTATSLNGKFVTKIGVEKSLRLGLTIQLIAGAWLVICGIFHLGYRGRSFNVCRFGIGSVQQCQCRHFGYVPRSSGYSQFTHRNVTFWYRFGSRSSALAFRHHLRAPNGICNGTMYRSRRSQLCAVSRSSHH